MRDMVQVDETEFEAFLTANEQRLKRSSVTFVEPPITAYYDAAKRPSPNALVCYISQGYRDETESKYFIRSKERVRSA